MSILSKIQIIIGNIFIIGGLISIFIFDINIISILSVILGFTILLLDELKEFKLWVLQEFKDFREIVNSMFSSDDSDV